MKTNWKKHPIEDDARALALEHAGVDDGMTLAVSFCKEGDSEIRLLEVSSGHVKLDLGRNAYSVGYSVSRTHRASSVIILTPGDFLRFKAGKLKLPEGWGKIKDGKVVYGDQKAMEPPPDHFGKDDLALLRGLGFKKHSEMVWILEESNLFVLVQHSIKEGDSFGNDFLVIVRDTMEYKEVEERGKTLAEPLMEALSKYHSMAEFVGRAGVNADKVLDSVHEKCGV
ncbi:MAG: hypothetical protein J6Y62_04585 [Clostridia bacterium]|nr:hypothetical protein [Clostridia bacterium]